MLNFNYCCIYQTNILINEYLQISIDGVNIVNCDKSIDTKTATKAKADEIIAVLISNID